MGGAWKRLVRSVKTVLKTITREAKLTYIQLQTVFTEAGNIINNRSLTKSSDDIKDLEALTPNHYLRGIHNGGEMINLPKESDTNSRKRWKQVQILTQHFWDWWRKE